MDDRPQTRDDDRDDDKDGVIFKDAQDTSSSLFDLRYLIGGLFTLYGVVLCVADASTDNAKAGGVHINLWLGLGMLVLGVFFLAWARLRPLHAQGVSARGVADDAPRRPPSI